MHVPACFTFPRLEGLIACALETFLKLREDFPIRFALFFIGRDYGMLSVEMVALPLTREGFFIFFLFGKCKMLLLWRGFRLGTLII